ncbi:MAG: nuclear transport factor 2 family protein [Candidatus Binatus sp.]|uniref:YybH family protein n=1 Tax=Candidatus Binatus sp. TaxID=2811406 RepID=UPI0027249BCA|nr:nuclear transport factor 2 family protein [Candidatus Binatus sp.]MDO8431741.1 nuclear transport factor 2 family protein [Candidatus Binatus sp.]
MATQADREEILRLHRAWWESNFDFDIPKMRSVFAGERYLQYNLNGHPYYGLGEKTKLWEALKGNLSIPEISDPIDLRLEITDDMAWLACENVVRIQLAEGTEVPGVPLTPYRIRSTEVYQRDDGAGNRGWKMWHFHCSPTAAENEPRMPFGDSFASRKSK